MTSNAADLGRHLAEITERFGSLAAVLGQAARELQVSGTLPPEARAEALGAARREFLEMRAGILEAARALSINAPRAAEPATITKPAPLVRAVIAAIALQETRRAAGRAGRGGGPRGRAARRAAPAPPPPPLVVQEVAVTPRPVKEDAGAARAVEQAAQDEAAQWWVSAWARWTSWKSSISFNDAVKQELQKYSYILSVPIQKSTDYEEGLLAYGYSILLEFAR